MTGQAKEWIVFGSFFLLLLLAVIAEIACLGRMAQTTFSKALAFVVVTDIIGFVATSLLVGVLGLGMFMVVMGPSGEGSEGGDGLLWAGLIAVILLPLAFVLLVKRAFLGIFRISSGGPAWKYSLVATFLIFILIIVPPGLIAYFL